MCTQPYPRVSRKARISILHVRVCHEHAVHTFERQSSNVRSNSLPLFLFQQTTPQARTPCVNTSVLSRRSELSFSAFYKRPSPGRGWGRSFRWKCLTPPGIGLGLSVCQKGPCHLGVQIWTWSLQERVGWRPASHERWNHRQPGMRWRAEAVRCLLPYSGQYREAAKTQRGWAAYSESNSPQTPAPRM